MPRPYRFLEVDNLEEMPNPYNLPVRLVRVKNGEWERQPSMSDEDAVRKFIRFAGIKSGKTIQVLHGDQDPKADTPREFKSSVRARMFSR